jgi:hypothetical protein
MQTALEAIQSYICKEESTKQELAATNESLQQQLNQLAQEHEGCQAVK